MKIRLRAGFGVGQIFELVHKLVSQSAVKAHEIFIGGMEMRQQAAQRLHDVLSLQTIFFCAIKGQFWDMQQ